MILVVGATGTNGKEVVQQLARAGHPVRALVRKIDKADDLRRTNVELAEGDLDDIPSIDRALAGVDHAFLVTPVDPKHLEWVGSFLDAAKRAGSPHLVKFSGMGASPDGPELLRVHHESDALLKKSGLPFTILRPNSFYQNMFWSIATIKDQGAFYQPMDDSRQSQIDVRDIAAVAVEALTKPGHEGKTYELTGPEAISFHQIAEALSEATGKEVRYVPVSMDAAEESMRNSGMPEWNVSTLIELYKFFASGAAARTTDTVQEVLGRPPIRFEQFARDHASLFA